MTKPIASLSLDLDNKWAYLRTHGAIGWDEYPSYLDTVVPRIIGCCAKHQVPITCFVVGRDAQLEKNHDALAALAAEGYEMGNHSLNHEPWLHTFEHQQLDREIIEAEEAIEEVTGQRPIGFRGPGYSLSQGVLEILVERGYRYDASTLPTFIGPLARWYFHRTATAEASDQADQRQLFGSLRDGWRPNKPYIWSTAAGEIVEIPVTTFPVLKLPIHMTYLTFLWQRSPRLSKLYLKMALSACRWLGVAPSLLLHPLDFLGTEDDPELKFFPGMGVSQTEKIELLDDVVTRLKAHWELVPMQQVARQVHNQLGLPWTAAAADLLEPEPLTTVAGEAE